MARVGTSCFHGGLCQPEVRVTLLILSSVLFQPQSPHHSPYKRQGRGNGWPGKVPGALSRPRAGMGGRGRQSHRTPRLTLGLGQGNDPGEGSRGSRAPALTGHENPEPLGAEQVGGSAVPSPTTEPRPATEPCHGTLPNPAQPQNRLARERNTVAIIPGAPCRRDKAEPHSSPLPGTQGLTLPGPQVPRWSHRGWTSCPSLR